MCVLTFDDRDRGLGADGVAGVVLGDALVSGVVAGPHRLDAQHSAVGLHGVAALRRRQLLVVLLPGKGRRWGALRGAVQRRRAPHQQRLVPWTDNDLGRICRDKMNNS